MEILNGKFKIYFQEYLNFMNILSKKIEFSKLNNYGGYFSKKLLNNKDLPIAIIIFSEIKNNLAQNSIEEIFTKKINNQFISNFSSEQKDDYKYNLLCYWHHYLIIALIEELDIFLKEKRKKEIKDCSFFGLSKIISLFHQNNNITYNLYKNKKINIEQIISLLDIYIFWLHDGHNLIDTEQIIFDLFYKLKNYFIFKAYFELINNIFLIEIKENDRNNNLKHIFEHLNNFNSIKSEININNTIILNNSSFHNFFENIISNMNKDIYNKYSKNIINFLKEVLSNNFELSKIFEIMIENMKKSFLNLSILKNEKNKEFENDIITQNFYCQLLKDIFDDNSDNLSYFHYNGIDSSMSYKIPKSNLSNTLIIFSFKFNPKINSNNEKIIYPLVSFYNESKNVNIFKLYIKYIKKTNKFYLFTTEEKKKYALKEINNIEKDKIYYIALYFEKESMTIFSSNDKKGKIEHNSRIEFDIVHIGCDNNNNFFGGVFGPFFMLDVLKEDNITNTILYILKLRDKYPEFIYSMNKDTIYNFSYMNKFKQNKNTIKEQINIKTQNLLTDLTQYLSCKICITPFILECYTFIREQSLDKYYLPAIPNICEKEKYYNIYKLNISLIKSDKIGDKFLMNNGLYYICLQYEYFFQLFSTILSENINIKIEQEIIDIINNILNYTLIIISKFSDNILNFYKEFKMIFLNLLNCMKKFSLLTGKPFSDSFINNFGTLMCLIFNDIEDKRQNSHMEKINKDDINKLVVFRDSLIDFLFTKELYKNSDIKLIQYIFSLLISISKEVSDKIFITNPNLIWKILSFIQLLEDTISAKKLLSLKNDKKNAFDKSIKDKIFGMLKEYFLCIKSEEYHHVIFIKLFYYCLNNYKNKYIMFYYFLQMIHDLIIKEYYLGENEIDSLLKYGNELFENNKNIDEIYENNIINDENNIINEEKIIINEENNININNENNIINKEKEVVLDENGKIKNKIISKILLIVIDLMHLINKNEEIETNIINLLNSIHLSKRIMKSFINEIYDVVTFILRINNSSVEKKTDFNLFIMKKNEINLPKVFSKIFKFIFELLKMINESFNNRKIQMIPYNNEILSLFMLLNNQFKEEFKKANKNDNIYFIFQKYIKLENLIVFSKIFNDFSLIEADMFIFNLTEIAQLCLGEYIFNTNILLKIKLDGKYYQKTFIEIIIDIYISILFNYKFLKSHKAILQSLNNIIFNPIFVLKEGAKSIFYFNDVIYNQKKIGTVEQKIITINNSLNKKNKEKFEMSFTTFALLKFATYYIYLSNNLFELNNDMDNFMEKLINILLKEQFELYKMNHNIFLKNSKNIIYRNLKEEIVKYIIEKNKIKNRSGELNVFSDFKKYFEDNLYNFSSVSDEITSGNCNIKNNLNESRKKMSLNSFSGFNSNEIKEHLEGKEINFSMTITESIKTMMDNEIDNNIFDKNEINILDPKEVDLNKNNNEEKKEIDYNNNNKNIQEEIIHEHINENREINLSEFTKNTYFLEDIDNYYISNIKKDIMNNIFSLYFIDTFFTNSLFKRMKSYYCNKYKDVDSSTKVMNFPSKVKRFNNGLEPDIILKLDYKFFYDKYFPISHIYFYDYMKENKISPSKYIKLYHKDIDLSNKKNILSLDCELIQLEKNYFGQIFYEENKNLIFEEKKIDFSGYNETIFNDEKNGKNIFSLAFLSQKLSKVNKKEHIKSQYKRKKKIVIINLDEIDEIIEKRCLLMWQAIEIYLKNGKSYFFNLLTDKNKDTLLKEFEKESKIKNLIHKKEFLEKEKHIKKGWKRDYISTYENLLLLNKYGSRSFNDTSQYYVFPWILKANYDRIGEMNQINDSIYDNKNENELLNSSLRIFKYPLCLQNPQKREDLIEKYRDDEEFPHHLGIHYSTASYIYYYLMRELPYSNLLIKLQNYQQENPNRMFLCLQESNTTLQNTKDSRELIPELFSHLEYFINLNCAFLGIKYDKSIVDDHNILAKKPKFNIKKNNNPFFNYVYFIIEHKKLLNSKIVSKKINEWIDNIFGIGQFPSSQKARENSFNIFVCTSYEEKTNIKQKYLNYIEEAKINDKKKEFFKLFLVDINLVVNFGVVPYQIFKKPYYKKEFNKKKKNEIINNDIVEDNGEHDGFEEEINLIKIMNQNYKMKEMKYYNYFEINSSLNKIFVLSEERYMEVVDASLYSSQIIKKEGLYNDLSPLINIQLPYFSLQEKIEIKNGYSFFLYNVKYVFSSFDKEPEESIKEPNSIFKTYGRILLEDLKGRKTIKENKEKDKNNKKIKYFKFITCRYTDKSFKIHHLPMEKYKNIKIPKIISYVCEDYVTSCCTISFCQFLIGLKNGKLIQCSLDKTKKIKIERYIRCHHGKINVIEVNKKLGLIITCGDDNYILIRKLYDFELLSPIKIKEKYVITLVKVSPNNFLYILCFNKIKNLSVIFGFTLNGLKFAKSEYGYYNNFDFTNNGNIVTLKNNKHLCILHGANLDYIQMDNTAREYEVINKIKNAIWLKYDYFLKEEKKNEYVYNKIITYINENKTLITLDVSDNYFFN